MTRFESDPNAYRWFNDLLRRVGADPLVSRKNGYIWGTMQAAHLARALHLPRISVIEFGVAGGTGLVALERAAELIGAEMNVAIDVYGFDTGVGLPAPRDHRDLPNLCDPGDYVMDQALLRSKLRSARLVLGPIGQTLAPFLAGAPAPVGFVSIDVDYYSSTMEILPLFDAGPARLLPRVFCYLDDILGFTCSEFTGEVAAIHDFNAAHPLAKISVIPGLRYFLDRDFRDEAWPEKTYIAHLFGHPDYAKPDGLIRARTLPMRQSRYTPEQMQSMLAERLGAVGGPVVGAAQRWLIFGASLGGERAAAVLPKGSSVVAFLDNDPKKQGGQLCGHPIAAPGAIASMGYDRIMIASCHFAAIFRQLIDLGVPAAKIDILPVAVRAGVAATQTKA